MAYETVLSEDKMEKNRKWKQHIAGKILHGI